MLEEEYNRLYLSSCTKAWYVYCTILTIRDTPWQQQQLTVQKTINFCGKSLCFYMATFRHHNPITGKTAVKEEPGFKFQVYLMTAWIHLA